jgi:transposase
MTVKVILSYILSRAPAKSAWNRQAISYIARTKAQKELDNKPEMYVIIFTGHLANDSATPTRPPTKRQSLRRHGTLNPHPEAVSHPLFHNSDFFDSDDLMQVKYEMLRQVHIDKGSISESAQAFGFSRPSFYQAQAALQQDGVFGLLPHRRGPQGGHKLTTEVMEFVAEQRSADSSLTPEQLAEAIQRRFRIQVHPRSIQRRLLRQKKRR